MHKYQISLLLFTGFFISLIFCCTKNKLIVVMGASCSGKSTLSKELLQNLGDGWKFVELDEIEDQCKAKKITITNEELITMVVYQVNEHLDNKYNVLVDTNIYHNDFSKIDCDYKKIVWVYCPLNILLVRNAERDKVLQRRGDNARYAREYTQKTFYNFENYPCYDLKIDSSLMSLDESLEKIFAFIF